ncbi:glycosyltransferase family 4 protein [Hymenobacter tibetensis]|uniref:Glycosyltransferase family 4 protein n=1 Tax=Hymenobacter tibetensis TaxID=497967 RepID=A0ABY4D0J8_9BACT|nr:glycosyltransferase family 1 protein [Hymenobacter tibetensis]UOG75943.1 glycosyltransferase family 4 protein [Hymenobacter tibetensis]
MKVLFDHQIFVLQKFGGISRYFNEIMKMHSSEIDVMRVDPALFIEDQPVQKNNLLARGTRFLKRKIGASTQVHSRELPVKAEEQIRGDNFDLLHPTYYGDYFDRYTDKPFVLTVYDMIHEVYKENFSLNDPISHNKLVLCNKASMIIAISHKTKEDLVDIFGINEDKVHVTHLASDFNKIVAKRPNIPEGVNKYVLFVGNRGLYKNFYFMVMSLTSILKDDKSLHILCTGHPFTKEEQSFFKDFNIGSQIKSIYLEDDSELAWVYQNAELFIFPSLYEGFGLPLLEAFASECPVVSSTGGSLPEVGGDAALYFDPKNSLAIQDAVRSVLYDSSLKSDLINKGKKRFAEFSWDRCRAETLAVYQAAIANA